VRLLSFGHGYSAKALAKELQPAGWTVRATTRTQKKYNQIEDFGIKVRLWPDRKLLDDIEWATHILVSIPPNKYGDPVLFEFQEKIIEKCKGLSWVGYLSTTGVYGNHNGDWVDEQTPTMPTTIRGKNRVEAENKWMTLFKENCLPVHIFRLAGIYGPGRGPFSKVKSGVARRIVKKNQVFSRIHVDDISQVLVSSMTAPNPGVIYNVCDDDPAPPQDVISYAAELLGLPEPQEVCFEDAELTEMARSFYAESKRVKNNRIKDELRISLKYPNYKEGLISLLENENRLDNPVISSLRE
jgi:nucleoside-diphosphate-sugar epimerase